MPATLSSARASAVVLLVALLAACGPVPEPRGPFPDIERDAGPQDARVPDSGRDTGPPPTPVLPAQSWTFSFPASDFVGGWTVTAAILIDARAETGSTRAVVGANGRSTNVTLDVVRPGVLVAREAIDFGTSVPSSDCRAPTLRLVDAELTFRDDDHDGIFERLVDVTGTIFVVDGNGFTDGGSRLFRASIRQDVDAPTLTLVPAEPAGAHDRIDLFASEPLSPTAVPFVEAAGRRFALHETAGASAPSHWWLALSSLPIATGYRLGFDGEVRDLAGNAAAALPVATFDIAGDSAPLADATFESGVSGVDGAHGARELVGLEVPLAGARSAFASGRTVVRLSTPRSASFVSFLFRVHSEATGSFTPWLRARDDDGRMIGLSSVSVWSTSEGTVEGFPFQSEVAFASISFPSGRDSITLELDLFGTDDVACSSIPRSPEDVGLAVTLDSFEVR
jgi:hypothetical protein